MLRPTKHSHPDRTVINASLILLKRLKNNRTASYDELRLYLRGSVLGGDAFFMPALSFLYILGVVEYRPKTDALEYVGPDEAI